jgi:L,D-transpeptidase ErfK/SrfK
MKKLFSVVRNSTSAAMWIILLTAVGHACGPAAPVSDPLVGLGSFPVPYFGEDTLTSSYHRVRRDIAIHEYFEYLDSVVAHLDSILPYPINEYLLARSNPQLIDSLAATDYYQLMARGKFIYDPNSIVVLHRGDSLLVPNAGQVENLLGRMSRTRIDINIPEFKLRVTEGDSILFTALVRVGRNETKFLAMAGRKVDLRTQPGQGKVIRINRNPIFINPSNNHRYTVTRRDDQRVTRLPRIPWIEVELNGRRYGQLIHPTTNPETLGRAYSNGCIGTRESDAWRIYYYAPLGTEVRIRYDLKISDENGDSLLLKDIYPQRFRVAGLWENDALPAGVDFCDCR